MGRRRGVCSAPSGVMLAASVNNSRTHCEATVRWVINHLAYISSILHHSLVRQKLSLLADYSCGFLVFQLSGGNVWLTSPLLNPGDATQPAK